MSEGITPAPSDPINYEMAYFGACVQIDALEKMIAELKRALKDIMRFSDEEWAATRACDALYEAGVTDQSRSNVSGEVNQ